MLIGGIAKYGLILLASGLFIEYWDRGTATVVVLIMVIGVIIALIHRLILPKEEDDPDSEKNATSHELPSIE